ncbi:uncharacterized protein LOC110894812 [Helianthus annuus]|uniref:uncharacterized protein LOC110894812 n=1 Tax=Helianthus annuus TaxID=4232 RepID=UPI000B8F035A|nr:uncharacterized protein LOC110894812 [Helianthus annuus]
MIGGNELVTPGEFSVGAAKRYVSKGVYHSNNYVIDWCKLVPLKCNAFVWRAEMGKIPMALALKNRNIDSDDLTCHMCGSGEYIVNHLFSRCIIASRVWHHIVLWCKVPPFVTSSTRELLEVHNAVGLSNTAKEVFQGIVSVGCWSIWRLKNKLKFEDKQVWVEDILSEIKSIGFYGLEVDVN